MNFWRNEALTSLNPMIQQIDSNELRGFIGGQDPAAQSPADPALGSIVAATGASGFALIYTQVYTDIYSGRAFQQAISQMQQAAQGLPIGR
jgi:hypothetical protein